MVDRLTHSAEALAEMFGIEIDPTAAEVAPAADRPMCPKCNGKGKFYSYAGRPVGPCFTCDGTGLARHVGVTLEPDACVKCLGSGEWRPGRECFACNGTGKVHTAAAASVDVSTIATAFAAARGNGIKRPKLRLDTFVFSRAPDTGRNAGAIYVTENGEYLGKVADGTFQPARACDDATTARIVTAAADPHSSATAYGMKTGVCSCCGRELTNGLSVELGIGPICRDKFGW